uniref:RNase H type-1 domain-containing protein n=1 Tax=Chenopodium quinoa TaxID=63459 RepID=A0A803N4K3_CHEQI
MADSNGASTSKHPMRKTDCDVVIEVESDSDDWVEVESGFPVTFEEEVGVGEVAGVDAGVEDGGAGNVEGGEATVEIISDEEDVVFVSKRCVISGVLGFLRLVSEYGKYNVAVECARAGGVASRSSWQPSTAGGVKVNTDAMLIAGGLHLALQLEFSKVELEGDTLAMVNAVNQGHIGRSPFDLDIEDIKETCTSLVSFSYSHVKRCGNVVAHFAARLSPLII